MARTVLLLHELPDGTSHFDWLLEREAGDDRLLTFRCAVRPDVLPAGGFECLRLPDHRAAYLTHEGPVSGDRGRVSRVWGGEGELERMDEELCDVTIRVDGVEIRWCGRAVGDGWWRFNLAGVV